MPLLNARFSPFSSLLECAVCLHPQVLTLPKCSEASEAILGISNLFVVKISVRKLAMWGPQGMQESQLDFLREGSSHTSDLALACLEWQCVLLWLQVV